MPGFFWASVVLTAARGQLDEREAAQKSLCELLAMIPNFAATGCQQLEKWLNPELAEHFIDGLRKAGLEIPESGWRAIRVSRGPLTGEARL